MLYLTTKQLQLIASTVELARADCEDLHQFSLLLDAVVPENWPPQFNDDESKRYTLNKLLEDPTSSGWHCWYFILNLLGTRTLIGIGGFKDKPDFNGVVEIGYGILPQFQRHGYGSEAVQGLLHWAFAQDGVNTVVAETLPQLIGSIGVLQKLGFAFIGNGTEEGVIRFAMKKAVYIKQYSVLSSYFTYFKTHPKATIIAATTVIGSLVAYQYAKGMTAGCNIM